MAVPLRDELHDGLIQRLFGREIGETKAFPLKNAEPLLDLIHPGAMDRGEMELKPGVLLEPFPHLFPMVDTHIVTDDVNDGNGGGRLPIDPVEKADEFLLSLAAEVQTDDFAGSGIEGRKEVQGPISFVLMLDQIGLVSRLCGLGGEEPGSWLQGCFLIHRENRLVGSKGPGIQVDDVCNTRIEGVVPWVFGGEPHVVAPGLELMMEEDATNGLIGDALHDSLFNELSCQFLTVPLGQGFPYICGSFARHFDKMDGDLRREKGGPASTWFIIKTSESSLLEPLGPFVNRATGNSNGLGNLGYWHSIGEQNNDTGPPCLSMTDRG